MLLTLTTPRDLETDSAALASPTADSLATDLGFLLHQPLDRVFTSTLPLGHSRSTPGRARSAARWPCWWSCHAGGRVGALRDAFGTVMNGRSKERQPLANRARFFAVHLPALPSRGGPDIAGRLFRPLGCAVEAHALPLDQGLPERGESPDLDLRLSGTVPLRTLLAHLAVLIPVLILIVDDAKHSSVDEGETDRLRRLGDGWLDAHPERALILHRTFEHQRDLLRLADPQPENPVGEAAPSLNATRLAAVEAKLPPTVRARLTLIQGSLTCCDARLRWDAAAALVEVTEHHGETRPGTVVMTTPHAGSNARSPFLEAGATRHADHRFEWNRETFHTWAAHVAKTFGYGVTLKPVGKEDPDLGPPTQMAVFARRGP